MSIDSMCDFGYVNQAACGTILCSSAATVVSALQLSTCETGLKVGVYATLALGCMTATGSAITAWIDPSSKDVKSYLKNVKTYFGVGIAAVSGVIAQSVGTAIIQGFSAAIRQVMYDKIMGTEKNEKAKKPRLVI